METSENKEEKAIEATPEVVNKQLMFKRRSSFFNFDSPVREKLKKLSYVKRLERETEQWGELLSSIKIKSSDRIKQPPQTYDESILTDEQKEFLSKRINIEEYLKGNNEFAEIVLVHTKKIEWVMRQLEYIQRRNEDANNEAIRMLAANRETEIPNDRSSG